MSVNQNLFGIHGTSLVLRSQRLMMLASNIANAGTPGYKARDIDFGAALDAAKAGSPLGTVINDAVSYRVPTTPSLDGNTVELSTEQTLFAENSLQYRASLAFLEGRISNIKRALKGE